MPDDTFRGDRFEPPYTAVPRHLPTFSDCARQAPGHRPHHIQVRLSAEAQTRESVVVMDVDRESAVVAAGDQLLRVRTHDAPRLAALVRRHGALAQLDRRHHVLLLDLPDEGHRAAFSVRLPGEGASPCSPADG